MLEERKVIDQLEVLRDGTVQVQEAIEVLRDGVVIASQYHRYVIPAHADTYEEDKLDPAAKAVVEAARTPTRRAIAQANYLAADAQFGGEPGPGPAWVQPEGAHNAYREGARVTHNGKQWASLMDANVWEPGVTGWTELVAEGGAPAAWVQPAGAHDAYQSGDRVSHNGQVWTSDIDANVWEPGVHGWTPDA
jgi:hypothetical protein